MGSYRLFASTKWGVINFPSSTIGTFGFPSGQGIQHHGESQTLCLNNGGSCRLSVSAIRRVANKNDSHYLFFKWQRLKYFYKSTQSATRGVTNTSHQRNRESQSLHINNTGSRNIPIAICGLSIKTWSRRLSKKAILKYINV
jgi:hypothetical protein